MTEIELYTRSIEIHRSVGDLVAGLIAAFQSGDGPGVRRDGVGVAVPSNGDGDR
jgi:hypothetical protein